MPQSDELTFLEEDVVSSLPGSAVTPWRVLLVDDEKEVHAVTKLALHGVTFDDRPLEFLHAYTGEESVQIMREQSNVALILMDVVMETDHAGLDAVRTIREDLGNKFCRIVLRTGQPGEAPERDIITQYDINDYKEKTDLTSTKLFTVVYTALTSYRDLMSLADNKRGLEKVIDASSSLLQLHSLELFSEGVLEQLAALLHLDYDTVLMNGMGLAALLGEEGTAPRLLATTGRYSDGVDGSSVDIEPTAKARIAEAVANKSTIIEENYFVQYLHAPHGEEYVFYLSSPRPILEADRDLLELFSRNVMLAMDNLHMQQNLQTSQRELVLMLSEAVEQRSKETGNHVRRVAEYSRILGRLAGLSDSDVEVLATAAPLHDAGKVAIPDAILNKPGKLTDEEMTLMKEHAELGSRIFEGNNLPVLNAARVIAGQHHEHWDGNGYPNRLVGEGIHIFGRIVAIADVFDALSNHRCYKPAWPEEQVLALLEKESGKQFDPALISLWMENLDEIRIVAKQLAD
jgi:response regulator RpfG family c-di-GMP phosphodiesterase